MRICRTTVGLICKMSALLRTDRYLIRFVKTCFPSARLNLTSWNYQFLSIFVGNEEQWTLQSLTQLAENNIKPRRLVTDGDSGAHRAADTLYNSSVLKTRSIRSHDPIHNARRMRSHVLKAHFSAATFPTASLRSEKQDLHDALSKDLPYRCASEHAAAYEHYGGDLNRVRTKMSYTVDCLVRCYQGDHSLCKRTSFRCRPHRPWYKHSSYIQKGFILKLEGEDLILFRKLVNIRLGPGNMKYLESLQSTQKCEAVNRSLSASNPKNVTFSRNFAGRMHSAAARVNRGPGGAMYDQLRAIGFCMAPGTRVVRHMLKMNRESDRRRAYFRTMKYKVRRCRKR